MTRDPYSFDFLTIRAHYDEKELKDALMENVQRLLMELGTGFAFVGREYRLVVGRSEQFLDLLFYNYLLHCFVVVEVKVSDFDPRDMGQLGTYVAAVDGIMQKRIGSSDHRPADLQNKRQCTGPVPCQCDECSDRHIRIPAEQPAEG
jgi:hypothetical protein